MKFRGGGRWCKARSAYGAASIIEADKRTVIVVAGRRVVRLPLMMTDVIGRSCKVELRARGDRHEGHDEGMQQHDIGSDRGDKPSLPTRLLLPPHVHVHCPV